MLIFVPRYMYGGGLTWSDKLISHFTVSLLIAFGTLSIIDHYIGTSGGIQCTCDDGVVHCDKSFINAACWSQNKYQMPNTDQDNIQYSDIELDKGFYQWIGLLLFFQALIAYFPRYFWLRMSSAVGFHEQLIIDKATDVMNRDPEDEERYLKYIVRTIDRLINMRSRRFAGCRLARLFCCTHYGRELTVYFLLTRVIYILAVLCDIWLTHNFSGMGATGLKHIVHSEPNNSGALPDMLRCHLHTDAKQNTTSSYMCALPANKLNQLIFAILWYWLLFVLACICYSLVEWFIKSVFRREHIRYTRAALDVTSTIDSSTDTDRRSLYKFVFDYLKVDGLFMLRVIESQTDYMTMCIVVASLWEKWRCVREMTEFRDLDDAPYYPRLDDDV